MSITEAGIYGAKRQSFRKASPRDLLKTMLDARPASSSAPELLKAFAAAVREDEECIEVIIEYWFTNNYRSLLAPSVPHERRREEARARINQIGQSVKTRIQQTAEAMLLDMIFPNGKPLIELTGSECKEFSAIGPLLKTLSQTLKPSQIVGDVYKPDKLREMYQRLKDAPEGVSIVTAPATR